MKFANSRRSFLGFLGALIPALGVSRLFAEETKDSTSTPPDSVQAAEPPKKKVAISLNKLKKIEKPGDGMIIELKGRKVLILMAGEGAYRALDTECRHKKCPVQFQSGWDEIRCKCHGSTYSLEGKVQKGPSKSDLMEYPVEVKDGKIILTLG